MKLHRTVLTVLLVAIISATMVMPIAANKPFTPVSFHWTNGMLACPEWSFTGQVGHFYCVFEGNVTASDPRLEGSYFRIDLWENQPFMNPQPVVVGSGWGACQIKWRMVVNADSGFEGTGYLNPWVDPSQWPRSMTSVYSGVGYGEFKGMHIWFSGNSSGENQNEWIWSGELRD